MSNHQKRLSAPDRWPVESKTETFTVKADAGPHGESGVPLLILLRDVLGYVDSRKEARYALDENNVVVNGTPVSDEERPVGMFDIVAFREREEQYRVFPDEGGRLALTPIDAEAAQSKLGKIIRKQQVPGGDTQLTLHDGQTLLVDDGYSVDDSVVVANDDDSIVAHFEYEEGALATAVDGKHAGQIGTIVEIQVTPGSSDNNVLLEAYDGDGRFETIEEYVVVIDENFTSDDETSEEEGDGETGGSDEEVVDETSEEEEDGETGGSDEEVVDETSEEEEDGGTDSSDGDVGEETDDGGAGSEETAAETDSEADTAEGDE